MSAVLTFPRRGRPRKFTRPARPVTITLPVDVIDALAAREGDLSRAIVRMAEGELRRKPHPPAELVTFGRRAVIAITPSRSLERRTGVSLVPLPDGRALISFDQAMSIHELELLIADAIEDAALSQEDHRIFQAIGRILKTARRAADITLKKRSIIVLQARSAARLRER